MPWGYLAGVTIAALLVLLTIASPRRPFPLARASFYAASGANEAPILLTAFLFVSTVMMVAEGDAGTPVAVAAMVVAAATLAGLAFIVHRATAARAVVGAALDEGLDPGWREEIAPQVLTRWKRPTPIVRRVLFPFPLKPRSVERLRNISYGPDRRNRLDIYRPRGRTADAPVMVYFHGGGYFGGRKSIGSQSLLHHLARQGWLCISVDYRIQPRARFREHLTDAKLALAWAHEHADEYGSTSADLVAAGSSAGAHLVSICALTQGDSRLQSGFESADTSMSAAVCLYGYYGYYYGMKATDIPISSPFGYPVPADSPSVFIAHGALDTYTPVETARQFAGRLQAESPRTVVYAELPGAHHNFDLFRSVRFEAVTSGIESFADAVLRR